MNNKINFNDLKGRKVFAPVADYSKVPCVRWKEEKNRIMIKDIDQERPIKYRTEKGDKVYGKVTGYAMVTGEVSNVMVIDLDRNHGNGADGVKVFQDFIDGINLSSQEKEQIDNTLMVQTPNGGKHLYFVYKKGMKNTANVLNGVDIRTDGGIIMFPEVSEGRCKETGEIKTYEIIKKDAHIQELPEPVYRALCKRSTNTIMSRNKVGAKSVNEGSRNTYVFQSLSRARIVGRLDDETLREFAYTINKKCCKPPLSDQELNSIYNSVINYSYTDGIEYPAVDDYGKALPVWENLAWLLKCENIDVKFNKLTREIEFNKEEYKDKPMSYIETELYSLCKNNRLNLSSEQLYKWLCKIAKDNEYNPAANYFIAQSKKWDGRSRIQDLSDTIQSPERENEKLKMALLKRFLISCVHMAMNDGTHKSEGILVVNGKQGIGKTRWIISIIPNLEWLKIGEHINPDDKDSIMKNTKYLIVELGELDSTLKKEQSKLKAFFSQSVDEYRAPYDRKVEKHFRYTSFYATINEDEFLKDTTGNRRYWVINAEKMNIDHKIDIDQLWAEVAYLYFEGIEKPYLSKEEMQMLNQNNVQYEVKNEVLQKIEDSFMWEEPTDKWTYRTALEISNMIGANSATSVGKQIKNICGVTQKKTNKGSCYLVPPYRM